MGVSYPVVLRPKTLGDLNLVPHAFRVATPGQSVGVSRESVGLGG